MVEVMKNEDKKMRREKMTFIGVGVIVVFELRMAVGLKRVICGLGGEDRVGKYFGYSRNVVFILEVLGVVIGGRLM